MLTPQRLHILWDLSRRVKSSEELTAAFDEGVDGLLERLSSSETEEAKDFLSSWDDFLFEFGCRGPNEYEIFSDTWETRPAIALALLDRIRLQSDDEDPAGRHKVIAESRITTINEVREKLAALGNEELTGTFEASLNAGNIMVFKSERRRITSEW